MQPASGGDPSRLSGVAGVCAAEVDPGCGAGGSGSMALSHQKIQRWIDLLAALLRRRFPAPLEELAREVPGYDTGQNKAALRRTFERDKDELRAFGIPIETVTAARWRDRRLPASAAALLSPLFDPSLRNRSDKAEEGRPVWLSTPSPSWPSSRRS